MTSYSTRLLFLSALAEEQDRQHTLVLGQLWVSPARGTVTDTFSLTFNLAPQECYEISHSKSAHCTSFTEANRTGLLIFIFQYNDAFIWATRLRFLTQPRHVSC